MLFSPKMEFGFLLFWVVSSERARIMKLGKESGDNRKSQILLSLTTAHV
jgi:hypothetical protein